MKDRPEKDLISQTSDIYSQMTDEARRRAQQDEQAVHQRGPVTKLLLAAGLIAGLIAAATLVYGFITFPDAPIRQTASGYVGKHGEPHTGDEYERFKLWEKVVAVGFGLAMLTGLGAVVAEKRRR